jgi:hypothetical protein
VAFSGTYAQGRVGRCDRFNNPAQLTVTVSLHREQITLSVALTSLDGEMPHCAFGTFFILQRLKVSEGERRWK